MSRRSIVTLLALFALPVSLAAAGGKPEPKESVTLAKSWDAAVAEARLLNVPIVVHSHGFFCGPCWGMHSALMLNKKYIGFAGENTVEVICLERLQEGVDQGDKRAETYPAKEGGREVEYLVEFPGLTVADMLALAGSKAGSYNKTGKIPYTCLVDPWTEEELRSFPGSTPAGDVMDAVTELRKALAESHGKGVARKDVRALAKAEEEASEQAAEGDYAKALAVLTKASAKAKDWPEDMVKRLDAARERVVAAATEAVDAIEGRADADKAKAKSELARIVSRLKGTGLEDRARELMARL